MDYALLLKDIRKELLISQTELAELLDVSFASVNRWENERFEPTIKAKRKIKELCIKNHIDMKKYERESD